MPAKKAKSKSAVKKRGVVVRGVKTSVSLEDDFWEAVCGIAEEREITMQELVAEIDMNREGSNLSSAVRLFVLAHFQAQQQA